MLYILCEITHQKLVFVGREGGRGEEVGFSCSTAFSPHSPLWIGLLGFSQGLGNRTVNKTPKHHLVTAFCGPGQVT